MSPSTGPKTPEGKARSSTNSYKHGLTARRLIMSEEESIVYSYHIIEYVEIYRPSGPAEHALVRSIADDQWRLQRARAFEDGVFAIQNEFLGKDDLPKEVARLVNKAMVWKDQHKALLNLTLYMQRIERSIVNNLRELQSLQNGRKQAQRAAEEEVKLLARAEYSEGREYDPSKDFPPAADSANGSTGQFVFSNDQVRALVDREDRLKAARSALRTAAAAQKAA